jgi:uncharacterized protein YutE (UPF0331/DUF86 family)
LVDPEVVRRRLEEIDFRVGRLESIQKGGREHFLAEPDVQAAAEHHLQIAVQAAIDIGNHILSEDFPKPPDSYPGVFEALGREQILDQELASRLASAARQRNLLVHLYLDVDASLVWESLEGIGDLAQFAAAIGRYLERP